MKKNFKILSFILIHFISVNTFAQINYKITIQGDPLMKNVNGSLVSGETNVRLKIYGDNNQTLLGGKICVGDFATVIIKDKPDIGNIIALDIELTGKGWSQPVKINNILIKKENDQGEQLKRFSFSCGCTVTQGNSLVSIDEAGAKDFTEAETAAPEFKLNGNFSIQEVSFTNNKVNGTISKTKVERKENKTDEPNIVPSNNPKIICTEEKISATASFDLNFILNPNEANLFPGALMYSEDIADGSYASYASGADLNPIKLTTSLAIVGGNPTITVVDPDLGTVNSAINDLLINQVKGKTQLQASFEVSEISSMEELILKVGAHANSATFDANLKFDLSNNTQKHIKMIKFVQKYYTLTMVQPSKPTDLFKNKQKATEAFESGKTPIYVNSITYGRIAYFFMETDISNSDIQAHLDGQYKGAITAGAELDLKLKNEKQKSLYSGTIIGGTGAVPIGGYEDFIRFIKEGGELDQTSLAVPIAYSCKFLADNKQAYVNLFSSYTKRTCTPVKTNKIKARIKIIDFVSLTQPNDKNDWGFSIDVLTGTTDGVDYNVQLKYDKGSNADAGAKRVSLKTNEAYSIDVTSNVFDIDLNQYNSGQLKLVLYGFAVRSAYSFVFTDRRSSTIVKKILMREALNLDMTAGALPKDFILQFEDMKVKFTYLVELIKE